MNQAIREQYNDYLEQAKKIAHQTLFQVKSEREYILAAGKYQQLIADARALKERFLDPEDHASANERELPEDEDDDPREDPAPRVRARPEPSRLDRHRARHVPRSV